MGPHPAGGPRGPCRMSYWRRFGCVCCNLLCRASGCWGIASQHVHFLGKPSGRPVAMAGGGGCLQEPQGMETVPAASALTSHSGSSSHMENKGFLLSITAVPFWTLAGNHYLTDYEWKRYFTPKSLPLALVQWQIILKIFKLITALSELEKTLSLGYIFSSSLKFDLQTCAFPSPVCAHLVNSYGHAKSLQVCPTLCHPMDHSPPGSSVHGILPQEYWSGLPYPPPGDLPNSGIEPASPAWQADSLPLRHRGSLVNLSATFKTESQLCIDDELLPVILWCRAQCPVGGHYAINVCWKSELWMSEWKNVWMNECGIIGYFKLSLPHNWEVAP